MDNQQERLIADTNWLAAAWESEGSFTLSKQELKKRCPRIRPICSIVNTDPDFVDAVISILKRNNLAFYMFKRQSSGRRTRVDINIYGMKRVQRFLNFIIPCLRSKVERAKTLKSYVDYRLSQTKREYLGDFEMELYEKLKKLNAEGNCY